MKSINYPNFFKQLFVVIVLLISCFNFSVAQKISIKGKVTSLDGNVLKFATVTLHLLPDSSLVTGLVSDSTGLFVFKDLREGEYFIKTSNIGFKPYRSPKIVLMQGQGLVDVGSLVIQEDFLMLKEVTVKGEMIKGTQEVDKTVYRISPKAAEVSNSGLELLRQVPSIQVDFQNNIALEGSSNILILVNGKEQDKNYLLQLDPKRIEKVEVMNNPSSKYDASLDGVINIILKSGIDQGLSGRIEAELPLTSVTVANYSANLEYGSKQVRIFTSGQWHLEKFGVHSAINRTSEANGIETGFFRNGYGNTDGKYGGLNLGVDWFVNPKNTLNFLASYNPDNGGHLNVDYDKDLWQNSVRQKFYKSKTRDTNSDYTSNFSVFYKRLFSKPSQELTLDLTYYLFKTKQRRYINDFYYDLATFNIADTIYQTEYLTNHKTAWSTRLDYTHPLMEGVNLSTGYSNYFMWMDDGFEGGYDKNLTNFKYGENRHVFYVSTSVKIKNTSMQGGLRVETSFIDIENTPQIDYKCLLPQFSFQQKINKTQTLKFNYRRAIERPGINDLNPFVLHRDSLNSSQGNPDLDPAYSNNLELTYNIQLVKHFLSPAVYYNFRNNAIQGVVTTNSMGASNTVTQNIGKRFEAGVKFSGTVKATKWLQFNPYFTYFYTEYKKNGQLQIDGMSMYSWRSSLSALFTLPRKIVLTGFGFYGSPTITYQRTNKRVPVYGFSIEKTVFKNGNGKLGFTSFVPLSKTFKSMHAITETPNSYQDHQFFLDVKNMYNLRFSYTFSKGTNIKKLERQRNFENDAAGSFF